MNEEEVPEISLEFHHCEKCGEYVSILMLDMVNEHIFCRACIERMKGKS